MGRLKSSAELSLLSFHAWLRHSTRESETSSSCMKQPDATISMVGVKLKCVVSTLQRASV